MIEKDKFEKNKDEKRKRMWESVLKGVWSLVLVLLNCSGLLHSNLLHAFFSVVLFVHFQQSSSKQLFC